MSTPSLQLAASLGVDVKFTSRCKASVALIAWGHWLLGPLVDLSYEGDLTLFHTWLTIAVWLEGLLCMCLYARLTTDRRTFASLAVLKVFLILYTFPEFCFLSNFVGMRLSIVSQTSFEMANSFLHSFVYATAPVDAFVGGPVTLLVTTMGPGRLAYVPVVGPYLSQYILGSNYSAVAIAWLSRRCGCCCRRWRVGLEPAPEGIELQEVLSPT